MKMQKYTKYLNLRDFFSAHTCKHKFYILQSVAPTILPMPMCVRYSAVVQSLFSDRLNSN